MLPVRPEEVRRGRSGGQASGDGGWVWAAARLWLVQTRGTWLVRHVAVYRVPLDFKGEL